MQFALRPQRSEPRCSSRHNRCSASSPICFCGTLLFLWYFTVSVVVYCFCGSELFLWYSTRLFLWYSSVSMVTLYLYGTPVFLWYFCFYNTLLFFVVLGCFYNTVHGIIGAVRPALSVSMVLISEESPVSVEIRCFYGIPLFLLYSCGSLVLLCFYGNTTFKWHSSVSIELIEHPSTTH